MPSPADERLKALGVTLPAAPKPLALYRPCLQHGNLLYLSGHGPWLPDGTTMKGVVGATVTEAEGVAAARQVALSALATVINHLGDLSKIKRLVKTLGFVASAPDFTNQPAVMNGWSELMREVFGPENGVGVRSAIGTNVLPGGISVEVECVFEVE